MEYQNIANLLGKPNNQLSKFRTRNWVGVSDYSNGTNEAGKQIKFYTWMLMPSLCDYSDAYILVKADTVMPMRNLIDSGL